MVENSELFIGFDVSKSSHAVAIAESGRMGEVRSYGSIRTDAASVRRFVRKLEAPNVRLRFCYEAGPTGYGLKRQIEALGHSCAVIAPSLIPRRPGERVKTDRRDAVKLARLFRAGELTEIWTPDEAHEALRDLVRTRESAIRDRTRKRQEIRSFLLRHGRTFPGKKSWGTQYFKWLSTLCFTHTGHTMVLHEMIHAETQCRDRVSRLEAAIEDAIVDWPLKPTIDRLQALRGVSLISSVTFMVEIGDIRRFDTPRQLMAYLGMVPSERSSGDTVRRGGITKTGNARVRRTLIEGAWAYRYQPKVTKRAYFATRHMPEDVRELAWKAQTRLTRRYRALIGRGTFIKERLSLAELGFRSRGNWLALKARELSGVVHSDLIKLAASLKVPETPSFERQSRLERAFGAAIEELNERLRRAGYPLHYHNGFLQFSDDKVIAAEIEEPFWNLVSGATWGNVDTDMKEAIDRRDTGGRDPALYAARALESAIKIISGEKGWTHGKEKGAHNFIENLASRGNGHFIEVWEGDQLKSFFTHVRNPLGHGPGGEDMPSLTGPQTDWAIAFCMAWIKSLIART